MDHRGIRGHYPYVYRSRLYTDYTYAVSSLIHIYKIKDMHTSLMLQNILDKITKKKEEIITAKHSVEGYKEEYYNTIIDALKATVEQNNGTTRILRNHYKCCC